MPRDLSAMANDRTLEDMSSLSKVSDENNSYKQNLSQQDEDQMIATLSQRSKQLDELHPYTQTLSLPDIESCVVLENAAFPPEERASREKVSPQSLPHECRPMSPCHIGDTLPAVCVVSCMQLLCAAAFYKTLHPSTRPSPIEHRSTSCATRCFNFNDALS